MSSVLDLFAELRISQHHRLAQIGSTVAGKVYVYRGESFDWRKLLVRHGCIDPLQYTTYKHSGDLFFAQTMAVRSAPWVTRNASAARLFVVPALLGLSSTEIPSMERLKAYGRWRWNRTKECHRWTYNRLLHRMLDALRKSPYWRVRPHLFMSGGWQTLEEKMTTTRTAELLFRHPKVIVAHYETGPNAGAFEGGTGVKGIVTVSDPYVGPCRPCRFTPPNAQGDCANEWAAAWARPSAKRPVLLYFRGSIDERKAYQIRASMCTAMQRVRSDGVHLCIRSAAAANGSRAGLTHGVEFPDCPKRSPRRDGRNRLWWQDRACFDQIGPPAQGGRCAEVVACSAPHDRFFCREIVQSRFAMAPSGDVPSSGRLFEAMEAGSLPVAISKDLLSTMSQIVPWNDFMFDVTAPSVNDLTAKIQTITSDEAQKAYEVRRLEMLRWMPLVSWNIDPFSVSMHILAQASLRIDEQQW